jgi:hypothetical protein
MRPSRKVLLIELNEITWDLVLPLVREGKLPTFERLIREGTAGAPTSVDLPPQLDPWITWSTVHTGRPQSDHNVFFLQQNPETIGAQRIWEICSNRGLRVGIFGSLCSWPPKPVDGYHVPDTFAPDTSTYPKALEPIQVLNLTYTRGIRLPSDEEGVRFKLQLGAKLVSLGLRASTAARVANQLLRERLAPRSRWKRVALQPLVNLDFFSKLYRRYRPHFATFHSNHVAHYQHTYWRAMQPERFEQPTSERERKIYGGSIEFGYRIADKLLEKMLDLADQETVVAVASSMGQKPYEASRKEGKEISQLRSLDRLLRMLGYAGQARCLATMSDQFNIYADSGEMRERILKALDRVYVDTPDQPMFYAYSVGEAITANLRPYLAISEGSRCYFPELGESALFEDLVHRTGQLKSGCHDPSGVLMLYGKAIKRGGQIEQCTNLDIAPTLLHLLGLESTPQMKGRVLGEAFKEEISVQRVGELEESCTYC